MDIQDEEVFPLSEGAARLPRRRRGRKTHVASLRRWSKTGLRGVKLEVLRVGGVTCTSVEALQRFFDALTAINGAPPAHKPAGAPRREGGAVEEELDSLDI